MSPLRKISYQVIALVILAFTIFAVGVTSLIGYQSYSDLESIALDQTKDAARLYAAEYEAHINRSYNALSDVGSNLLVAQQLTLLSRYGPLYSEDNLTKHYGISDADQSYYLLSQLHIARSLIHLLPLYDLTSITLYQSDGFKQYDIQQSVPSIIIDHEWIWLYRYNQKGLPDQYTLYQLPLRSISFDDTGFDVSAIYQHDANYFYNLVGAHPTTQAPPTDYLNSLTKPKTFTAGQTISHIGKELVISVWSPLSVTLDDPTSWRPREIQSATIVGVHIPDSVTLSVAANRIGVDLAFTDEDKFWVSSISSQSQIQRNHKNIIQFDDEDYLYAEVDLDISSEHDHPHRVMALTSTQVFRDRVDELLLRLSAITLFTVLLTSVALFLLIQIKLKSPLESLLNAVHAVGEGNLNYQVDIKSENELATLGNAFNKMTQDIKNQSLALAEANETLELKVRERTEELKNTQQQLILSEKMATLGQLVAGVAHEINTPLGNCITALTFNQEASKQLKHKFDKKKLTITDFGHYLAESQESLELMHTNLRKASELVHTFKNVAVNQSVEEIVEFSMAQHVQEVLTTLRPQLKKTQIELTVDIDPNMRIQSYPGAYYHIFSNMIVNSLNHGLPDGRGRIDLKVQQREDCIIIHYEDSGVGMPEEVRSRIFDPFYTTRRGEGGTGLGMYMTYNIVTQRLGGEITVESEVGHGTLFTMNLPLTLPTTESYHSDFTV